MRYALATARERASERASTCIRLLHVAFAVEYEERSRASRGDPTGTFSPPGLPPDCTVPTLPAAGRACPPHSAPAPLQGLWREYLQAVRRRTWHAAVCGPARLCSPALSGHCMLCRTEAKLPRHAKAAVGGLDKCGTCKRVVALTAAVCEVIASQQNNGHCSGTRECACFGP
jgi:hypothetical protein